MTWIVRLSRDAERQLRRLPPDQQSLIRQRLREMQHDPFRGDVIPLRGRQWQGRYRKRVGRYRIFFAQFIGFCSRSKWSKYRTKSPFLALLAMAGSNAAYKIISACSNAVS